MATYPFTNLDILSTLTNTNIISLRLYFNDIPNPADIYYAGKETKAVSGTTNTVIDGQLFLADLLHTGGYFGFPYDGNNDGDIIDIEDAWILYNNAG